MAYEDLQSALDEALALLETSWQEWQIKYGKVLEEEKQWILSRISARSVQEEIGRDLAEAEEELFCLSYGYRPFGPPR